MPFIFDLYIFAKYECFLSKLNNVCMIIGMSLGITHGTYSAIGASKRMIKVDEDENAICRNEENRTSLSLASICMQIRDEFQVAKAP